MRCTAAFVLTLSTCGFAVAAPQSQQLPFVVDSAAGSLASVAQQFASSVLDFFGSPAETIKSLQYPHFESKDEITFDSDKTIWDIINTNEHLTQLAHILNYSSDSTKELLKGDNKLTFFAPVNWAKRRHSECASLSVEGPGSDLCNSALQSWVQIETFVEKLESASATDKEDDKDKERQRKFIQKIIDASLRYHLVQSDSLLDIGDIVKNSSVATLFHVGKGDGKHNALNDKQPWRIRVGKSLLPRPGAYLNFYSRVVSPSHPATNGIIHAISAPLLPPPSIMQSLYFGLNKFSALSTALLKIDADTVFKIPYGHHHPNHTDFAPFFDSNDRHSYNHSHPVPHPSAATTLFAPSNHAWAKLPAPLRLYLFSPFGYRLLAAILMLHTLPNDIVFADSVHHVGGSSASSLVSQSQSTDDIKLEAGWGKANTTHYTFKSVLPKIQHHHHREAWSPAEFGLHAAGNDSREYEEVDVDVSRYYLLPGGRGPLQTRIAVQKVGVLFQDIPAANGAIHLITEFIKPKGHPHAGLWTDIAREAAAAGFGEVDLVAEAAKPEHLAW